MHIEVPQSCPIQGIKAIKVIKVKKVVECYYKENHSFRHSIIYDALSQFSTRPNFTVLII